MPSKPNNLPETPPEPPPPSRVSTPISVLGDFELRHEIGRGGMGTVYEAWQRSLRRTVALKVLSRAVSASPNAVARFQREAQAAAKLHHIHIVPIFALGEQDGTYYYAMEYVEGPSLNTVIAGARSGDEADTATFGADETVALPRSPKMAAHRQDARPAAGDGAREEDTSVTLTASSLARPVYEDFQRIAAQIAGVADALSYAHQNGVIHRDIKPHNLLVGSDGRLRVSDFGLARLAEQPGVTVTGELVGSPMYMSPEQLSGDPGGVDHRTDIYSLGATLYEWLTLSPPYPGDTRERVISAILTSQARPARARNPQIPVDLETICLKAMERDPKRRYADAAALRDDLQRFLERRPIKAKRAGAALRAARFVRRHQVASIASVAAAVALVLGTAWWGKRGQVEMQSQAVAELQEKNEQILDLLSVLPLELGGPLRVAGAVQGMVDAGQLGLSVPGFGGSDKPGAVGVGTPTAIAMRAITTLAESAEAASNSASDAKGNDEVAGLLRDARELRDDDPQRAWERLDSYLSLRPDDFRARQMRAGLSARIGRIDDLLEDANHLVRLHPESALAYVWRGLAYLVLDQIDKSVEDLTVATRLAEDSAWVRVARGLALIRSGRAGGAILEFEEALRLMPGSVVALLGRASANSAFGKMGPAKADAERVLEEEPQNVDALTIRGDCNAALGDLQAAAADFEKAINLTGRNNAALALRYLSVLVQLQRMTKGQPATGTERTPAGVETRVAPPADGSTEAVPTDWLDRMPVEPSFEGKPAPASTRPDTTVRTRTFRGPSLPRFARQFP